MSRLLERRDVRTYEEDLPDSLSGPVPSLVPVEFDTEGHNGARLLLERGLLEHAGAAGEAVGHATRSSSEGGGEEVNFDLEVNIRGRGKLARLHLRAERRYREGSAVLVLARTMDGLAEFRLVVDPSRPRPYSFHMSTAEIEGAKPEEAWPILEFLSLSKAPNEFSLGLPDKPPIWNPIPHVEAPIDKALSTLVLQLRTVARHTGVPIRVPADFSRKLCHSLDMSAQLIAGGVVSGTWRSAEILVPSDQVAELTPDHQFRVELPTPLEFTVGDVRVSVDRWARLHSVRFSPPRATAEGLVVRLEPAGDDRVEYRRGPWLTAEEQQEAAASVVEGDWVAMLGDAVIGWNAELHELIGELVTSEVHPDKIVRAVPSDLPAMP